MHFNANLLWEQKSLFNCQWLPWITAASFIGALNTITNNEVIATLIPAENIVVVADDDNDSLLLGCLLFLDTHNDFFIILINQNLWNKKDCLFVITYVPKREWTEKHKVQQ